MLNRFMGTLILLLASLSTTATAETYTIDTAHTRIGFSVSHMVISSVIGDFKTFNGTVDITKGVLTAINATIDATSIDTANAKRDAHLNSPDFLDTATYPKITFQSTKVSHSGKEYTVVGTMTIRNVTKPLTLKGQFKGEIIDPWGNKRAGFHAQGVLNRREYGLAFNKLLEGGGLVVGDEVTIILDVEAILPKAKK